MSLYIIQDLSLHFGRNYILSRPRCISSIPYMFCVHYANQYFVESGKRGGGGGGGVLTTFHDKLKRVYKRRKRTNSHRRLSVRRLNSRLMRNSNLNLISRKSITHFTIHEIYIRFTENKIPISRFTSHVIYCISCTRCSILYIGQSGQFLSTRFTEQRRVVIN